MANVIKLRVLPVVGLPHMLRYQGKTYILSPDEDIPAELATALIKKNPKLYQIAKGEADLKEYTFKKTFKTKTMVDLVASLTDDEQIEVAKFIDKMRDKAAEEAKKAEKKAAEEAKKNQNKE